MKKIFINYSWEYHTNQAEKLYSALSNCNGGYDVWMDKNSMPGGLEWRPAIRKAIREANFFISLFSSESGIGRGVRNREIKQAIDILDEFPPTEIYLIPLRLNECESPYEEINALNWIDLFPKWEVGVDKLLTVLANQPKANKSVGEDTNKISAGYHYRIGIVDLDMGLSNLNKIIDQLNSAQNYFLFTHPNMPSLKNMTEVISRKENFAVYKVPESYISQHQHLAVDLIACITKYALAFEEKDGIVSNYFSGPSGNDERFLFLSADHLYEYVKVAGDLFEEGLVYILIGQLIAYFTEIGYHDQTRGCVMDFCENRKDIIKGLKNRNLCKECDNQIPEGALKDSILSLLSWKYK
ncbi:MAG: hypothetical protein JWN78_2797 [Bacteroidota bacterium]|nr:hypothetical protein [Bacteroidota bacterium]